MVHATALSSPRKKLLLPMIVVLAALAVPSVAHATSQWTRKYGVGCVTCHSTAFPRLNYYGERFMRNGYQLPGSEDGDTTKSAVGDRLFIDDIGNLIGIRLNVVPARVVTNALEATPGDFTPRVQLGNPDWLQVFTAGSVFRKVSIFIETEVSQVGEIHNSWSGSGSTTWSGAP